MRYYRINNNIRSFNALVIDKDGNNLGVMPVAKALELAKQDSLDLIEVKSDTNPPICKILDFGKFLYQARKKTKKTKKTKLKIIKIGFNTGMHDLEVKAKKIGEFLEKNYPVKIDLMLRGRENRQKSLARIKVEELLKFVSVDFKIESDFKFQPQGISLIITKR